MTKLGNFEKVNLRNNLVCCYLGSEIAVLKNQILFGNILSQRNWFRTYFWMCLATRITVLSYVTDFHLVEMEKKISIFKENVN